MSDKRVDEAKGRAKEAAGALTDDDRLRREGKADQAKSSVKNAIEKATGAVEDAADGLAEKVSNKTRD